ncbi:DUF11 domain-containing protein [Actinacidiphila epipremni]|uniref:DUF11 domain-containing protein n=1 Tax=Actinacidiphila epipremni TaxID=2053013 RepID=A0ABX0ZRG8_9ACTN|nr:DUF11 domain-containing protein [Actinacidiphila epipremni]NJP46564.1 hypothetical protein [Actinacidiphila epipremni]
MTGTSRTASADPVSAGADPGRLAYVGYGPRHSLQVAGTRSLSPYLPQGLAGDDCEPAARGDDVVFVSDRGGEGEGIYRRTSEGPVQTVLLRPGWRITTPKLSPDKQTIVFGSFEDRYGGGSCTSQNVDTANVSLWTVHTDGTGLTQVAAHGSSPDWSPDGTRLAYVDDGTVYVAPVAGDGHPLALSPPGTEAFTPAWEPDGDRVAYVVVDDTDYTQRLALTPANGGEQKLIAKGEYASASRDVAWAPDGRTLAFLSGHAYLVQPAGGCGSSCDPTRLLPDDLDDGYAIDDLTYYTPTGGGPAVLLGREDPETTAIEGVDAAKPLNRLLLRPTLGAEYDLDEPAYSPDGTRLAFTTVQHGTGGKPDPASVMVGPADHLADAVAVRTGFDETENYGRAAWSPDGTELAVSHWGDAGTEGGSDDAAVSVFDVTGGPAQARLLYTVPYPPPDAGAYACTTDDRDPAWSPDGRRIALSRYRACQHLGIAAGPGAAAPLITPGTETRHIVTVDAADGSGPYDVTKATCGGTNCQVQDARPAYRPGDGALAFTRRGDATPPTSDSPSPSPSPSPSSQSPSPSPSPSPSDSGPVVRVRAAEGTPDGPVQPRLAVSDGYDDSIILLARADGTGCHGVVPQTSGCPTAPPLPADDAPFYRPDDAAWSPTGDRIAVDAEVGVGDGRSVRLAVLDPATGTGEVLPNNLYHDDTEPTWQPSADLAVTMAGPSAPVTVGDTTTITLHLTDQGIADSPATQAELTLPAGLVAVGDPVPSQGACTAAALHCDLGTVPVGATADIHLTVRAAVAGTQLVTGKGAGRLTDRDEQDNTAAVTVEVVDPLKPDPAVTVTVTPPAVLTGEPATVAYTVTNRGDGPATGVALTVTLPAGVTVTTANPACPDVSCDLGTLAPGASTTVTRVVTSATALSGNAVGTVSSTSTDADPGNNTATAPLTVTQKPPVTTPPTTPPARQSADPAVGLSLAPATAYAGGPGTTARVTVRNPGHARATGLTLVLAAPPGVTPDAASACATAAGCPVADLDPGASTTVTVTLATPGALTGTVTANLSTTGSDSDTTDDTATAALTVKQPVVQLVPAVGPPGGVTQAFGRDFPPGARLQLRWDKGVTVASAPVRAAANGTFTAPMLVLVQDALGPRQLLVTDQAATPAFGEVHADYLVVPGVLQPSDFKWRR